MYIDAHNHLDLYGDRIDEALKIIEENKILTLACSMDEKSYLYSKKVASTNPLIIPCFGIHPWEAHKYYRDLDCFEEYIKETMIIGEIGLDYHWVEDSEKYPCQQRVFNFFLNRARMYDKVVNLHTKGAEAEISDMIKKYDLRTPIIHWYSGPVSVLRELLNYGCYFTIGVDIGYSKTTEEMLEILPMNRILTETDGPDSLQWVNGEYGYPDYVKEIVEKISEIKGLPQEEVNKAVCDNLLGIINGI